MPKFQDLSEILDPNLQLPINGKTYAVSSPPVAVGLRSQATVALAAKVQNGGDVTDEDVASLKLDDDEEIEFNRALLGGAYDEMIADRVPWEYVQHAAKTVFMWCITDRDKAAEVWANPPGKGSRKKPADRRPKTTNGGSTKKASSRSSSTSRRTPASGGSSS